MSNIESRPITIIANHINKNVRIDSDASTFGELKSNPEVKHLFEGNVRVIVRENRTELSMNDSKLPDGGFTLIVVSSKIKSGHDDYDEMTYHELRAECIARSFEPNMYNGIGVTSNVMRAHLRDDDELSESDLEETDNDELSEEDYLEEPDTSTSNMFDEMKSKIEEVTDKCKEEVSNILEEYSSILPDSVIPDYSETVEAIKRELGL